MTSAIMSGSTEHLSMPQKDSQTPCLIEMARGSDRKEAKAVPWFEAVTPLPKRRNTLPRVLKSDDHN